MPYLATIVVLALISLRREGGGGNAPACLGKPFSYRLANPSRKRQQETSHDAILIAAHSIKIGGAAAALPLLGSRAFAQEKLKVGFILLGPIGRRRLELGARQRPRGDAEAALGDKVETTVYVENVAEGPDSERVLRDLAKQGCKLIFTTSFGYMDDS